MSGKPRREGVAIRDLPGGYAGPDFTTDKGVDVWLDISDLAFPCDLADTATDNPQYVCAGTAESRYGIYNACNYHFERAEGWAENVAYEGRCDSIAAQRFEERAYGPPD